MAVVVTGGAVCHVSLVYFHASDGTVGMVVSGGTIWSFSVPVCLRIGSVGFVLEVRAETLLQLMFVSPMPSCQKMGTECNSVSICFLALGFGDQCRKNVSVFSERTQHSIGGLSDIVGNCVCFLMGIYFCSKEAYGLGSQQNTGPGGYWELWDPTLHPGAGWVCLGHLRWMDPSLLSLFF